MNEEHTYENVPRAQETLTRKELDEIKKRFLELDKDGNGHLTREELVEALTQKDGDEERPESDIDYMLKILDTDRNGVIGLSEFTDFMAVFVYNMELSEIKIIDMFKRFNDTNDGSDGVSISYEDAKYLWSMITTLKTTFKFEEFKEKLFSREERRKSMKNKMRKLDKILPLFDPNDSGRIEAEEFVKIMTPL